MCVVISNTNTLPEQLLAVVEKEMVRGQRLCLPPALLSGLEINYIRGWLWLYSSGEAAVGSDSIINICRCAACRFTRREKGQRVLHTEQQQAMISY